MVGSQDPSEKSGNANNTGDDSLIPTTLTFTPTLKEFQYWAKSHRTFVASSASGMVASGITFPLDSIKTRMQSKPYNSAIACIKDTYATEGVRAFWRAAWVPTISITAMRTTSFSIYQKAKYSFSDAIGKATGGDEPLVIVNRPGSTPTYATVACFAAAGCTAGSLTVFLSCPFELVKNLTQNSEMRNTSSMDDPVRSSYSKKGSIKTAMNVVKHRGYLGLWSGFRLHMLRDSIGSTIYFATYESVKQILVKFQGSNNPTSPLSVAIAGGLCGTAGWICTYPIDTAKTQFQRNCMTKTWAQKVERPKIDYFRFTHYRGLGVSLARTGFTNAIFFSCFELFKKKINKLPKRGEE